MAIYEDRVIKIADLARDEGVIENESFIGCHIKGPAILIAVDNTVITNCNLGGPDLDALFWVVPPTRPRVVGAIFCRRCTFEKCSFQGVGFAGPPELKEHMVAAQPQPGAT